MAKKRKPQQTVALTLRIKESLRRKLEFAATFNGVSLNREIERQLEQYDQVVALDQMIKDIAAMARRDALKHTAEFDSGNKSA